MALVADHYRYTDRETVEDFPVKSHQQNQSAQSREKLHRRRFYMQLWITNATKLILSKGSMEVLTLQCHQEDANGHLLLHTSHADGGAVVI